MKRTVELQNAFEENWATFLSGYDQLIFFIASLNNDVYVLPQHMGVYRKHAGGSWSLVANIKRLNQLYIDIMVYRIYLPLSFKRKMFLNWKLKSVLVGYLYENNRRTSNAYWIKRVLHIAINRGVFSFGPGVTSGLFVEFWLFLMKMNIVRSYCDKPEFISDRPQKRVNTISCL